MSIQQIFLSIPVNPIFKDSILSSTSLQKNKMIAIAAIAFGCLAACYLLIRYCHFVARKIDGDRQIADPVVIKLDYLPQTAEEYIEEGKNLALEGKVEFPDGSVMSQEQLFLKAVELDPDCSSAYNYLGTICDALSKIELPDGSELTQQELFLKALEIDPNNSAAHCNLGATLEGGGSLELPDRTLLSREKQFVRVIQKHHALPQNPLTQISLPKSSIVMNRRDLFLTAIKIDPDNSTAYYNLPMTLRHGEEITLPCGRRMREKDLFYEAVKLNSNNPRIYTVIARYLLPNSAPVELLNMQPMTMQELYLHSIKLDPEDAGPYYFLSQILNHGSTVYLPDGTEMDNQQLLLKAIDLNPYYSSYYMQLFFVCDAISLNDIKLLDGKTLTFQQLVDKIKDCLNKYGNKASAY